MEKIRAFIAVDVEGEKLKHELVEFQQRLLSEGADAKLVVPENLHLTLRFLGEIEEDVIQRIAEGMKALSLEPFEIQFKGVGAFPSITRMNVVWVAIEKGGRELKEIAETLEPCIIDNGIPPDRKGFSPHLTVARIRSGRNKQQVSDLLGELGERDFGSMETESIRLKKSVLTPDGPIYSTLFEVKAGNSVSARTYLRT